MRYYIDQSDNRNRFLLKIMKNKGYDVHAFSLDENSKSDYAVDDKIREGCSSIFDDRDQVESNISYVFSPAKRFAVEEIARLCQDSILYAGRLDGEAVEAACKRNIKHINLLKEEDFSQKNAALTAEGVLGLLIEKTPRSIFSHSILILGDGRCAKAIAKILSSLNLNLTVASRKKANLGEGIEVTYLDMNQGWELCLNRFDVIINTIPTKIIDDTMLALISKDALFLEIASVQCLNKSKAQFDYVLASGLPQVFCAQAAAELMLEYIK